MTADILLQVFVDSVAGGDDSDGFIKYILHRRIFCFDHSSSILTESEMSFTLYENMNMANTRIMYCYFEMRTA